MNCPSTTTAVSIEGTPCSPALNSQNQLSSAPRRCFTDRVRDAGQHVQPAIGLYVAMLLVGVGVARAEVVTFQQGVNGYTHQDATVRNDPTNINAPNNTTRVLLGTLINNSGVLRALFSFPLPGIAPGSVINSVKLTMGQDPDTGTSEDAEFTVEMRTISRSFFEGTGAMGTGGDTWNTTFGATQNPMTLGTTVLTSAVLNPETPGNTMHDFVSTPALVAAVQAAVNASQPFNFALVGSEAVENGTATRKIFRLGSNTSSPTTTPPNPIPPLLEINFSSLTGLAGDYDGSGKVDAADYVLWRSNVDGDAAVFAAGTRNPSNTGNINSSDYDFWMAHFDNSQPASGAALANTLATPEPTTICLLILSWVLASSSARWWRG